jgi:hypothetical protein
LVRRIVHDADPQMPVTDVQLMREVVSSQTAARRLQVTMLLAFAIAAFVLAAVGIHGLMSFIASRRRHEVGVRVALGATRQSILGMFIRYGLTLGVAGVVVALPSDAVAAVRGHRVRSGGLHSGCAARRGNGVRRKPCARRAHRVGERQRCAASRIDSERELIRLSSRPHLAAV